MIRRSNYNRLHFIIAFIFITCANGYATTFIDCNFTNNPSSENSGGRYVCNTGSLSLFLTHPEGSINGGFEHIPSGGWNNSSAAKFYTHDGARYGDSYRLLTADNSYSSPTQQNLRYLIKYGPNAVRNAGGKWHDTGKVHGELRTWYAVDAHSPDCGLSGHQPQINYNGTLYVVHGGGMSGACEGYQFCENPSTWTWDSTLESCNVVEPNKMYYEDYENEWIAVEIERHRTGEYKIYIWTQDGQYNGLYYQVNTNQNHNVRNVPVGLYMEGTSSRGSEYFIIDEVVIADQFIGPPAEFTGQQNVPAPVIHDIPLTLQSN